jgi:hypothetical protein
MWKKISQPAKSPTPIATKDGAEQKSPSSAGKEAVPQPPSTQGSVPHSILRPSRYLPSKPAGLRETKTTRKTVQWAQPASTEPPADETTLAPGPRAPNPIQRLQRMMGSRSLTDQFDGAPQKWEHGVKNHVKNIIELGNKAGTEAEEAVRTATNTAQTETQWATDATKKVRQSTAHVASQTHQFAELMEQAIQSTPPSTKVTAAIEAHFERILLKTNQAKQTFSHLALPDAPDKALVPTIEAIKKATSTTFKLSELAVTAFKEFRKQTAIPTALALMSDIGRDLEQEQKEALALLLKHKVARSTDHRAFTLGKAAQATFEKSHQSFEAALKTAEAVKASSETSAFELALAIQLADEAKAMAEVALSATHVAALAIGILYPELPEFPYLSAGPQHDAEVKAKAMAEVALNLSAGARHECEGILEKANGLLKKIPPKRTVSRESGNATRPAPPQAVVQAVEAWNVARAFVLEAVTAAENTYAKLEPFLPSFSPLAHVQLKETQIELFNAGVTVEQGRKEMAEIKEKRRQAGSLGSNDELLRMVLIDVELLFERSENALEQAGLALDKTIRNVSYSSALTMKTAEAVQATAAAAKLTTELMVSLLAASQSEADPTPVPDQARQALKTASEAWGNMVKRIAHDHRATLQMNYEATRQLLHEATGVLDNFDKQISKTK